jgi:tetratricopeptide (TPR) repeat protein
MAGDPTEATGKSFLCNIEKGKRQISPRTVGKLIKTLGLPEEWIDRFLDSDIAPEDEQTRTDREGDRLMRLVAKDETAPPTSEALLLMLAEQWAEQQFNDPMAAYNALKSALQAAADLKAQGNLPSNTSDQLQAVLRRVSDLNDQGLLEDANAALNAAAERHSAEGEALFEAQLKQDRLLNLPEATAKRLIARLRASAPPGGVFNATTSSIAEWHDHGRRFGSLYDLRVALELAKLNHIRAKGRQLIQSLLNVGLCHFFLGEHQGDSRLMRSALSTFQKLLKDIPRRSDPMSWAAVQNNLGSALQILGEREGTTVRLLAAVTAYDEALQVYTRDAAPMDWALAQMNLGTALRTLGEREGDTAPLLAAVTAYERALQVYTRDAAPMDWASAQMNLGNALRWVGTLENSMDRFVAAQDAFNLCLTVVNEDVNQFTWAKYHWNLADLTLARQAVSPDPENITAAQHHLNLARPVFEQGENHHQLAECDRLQALIAP